MTDTVEQLAVEHNVAEDDLVQLRRRILPLLRAEFGDVDNGIGGGNVDFWITLNEVEYRMTLRAWRSLKAVS